MRSRVLLSFGLVYLVLAVVGCSSGFTPPPDDSSPDGTFASVARDEPHLRTGAPLPYPKLRGGARMVPAFTRVIERTGRGRIARVPQSWRPGERCSR